MEDEAENASKKKAGMVATTPSPPTSDNDASGFQASARFEGARPGFSYKRGPLGVGYYRDERSGDPAKGVARAEQLEDAEAEWEALSASTPAAPAVTDVPPPAARPDGGVAAAVFDTGAAGAEARAGTA